MKEMNKNEKGNHSGELMFGKIFASNFPALFASLSKYSIPCCMSNRWLEVGAWTVSVLVG